MNEYLFTLANVVIDCEDGNLDADDLEYSCMYSVYDDPDGERPMIDMMSFKFKVWRQRKAEWVRCPPLAQPHVLLIEKAIQRRMDSEQLQLEENRLAVAEGWQ